MIKLYLFKGSNVNPTVIYLGENYNIGFIVSTAKELDYCRKKLFYNFSLWQKKKFINEANFYKHLEWNKRTLLRDNFSNYLNFIITDFGYFMNKCFNYDKNPFKEIIL